MYKIADGKARIDALAVESTAVAKCKSSTRQLHDGPGVRSVKPTGGRIIKAVNHNGFCKK